MTTNLQHTAPPPVPTILLRGGQIHGHPGATALVSRGGQIAWIGSAQEARAHEGAADEVVDLDGALVTAAFSDAHVHLTMTGQGLDGIDLSATTSVGEALRLVESASRHLRGRPIYAHSWDETKWAEGRPITAAELDRACYGGVVYMPRIDAHSASVSSAMAAVARVRGLDGWDGSGVVTRDAFAAVTNAFTSAMTDSDREHYLDLALRAASEKGIGLVHETGADHLTSGTDLQHVLEAGRRPARTATVAYWGQLTADVGEAAELGRYLGVLGLAGDLCADGSFGSRTAHLLEEYADEPGHGYGYLSAEQIAAHVVACTRAGLQAGGHVIGDAALHTMAEGFRQAAEVVGVEAMVAARHRWEHVELPDAQVLATMAELGIWASMQPAFDGLWGGTEGMYAARLGEERALAAVPLRAMVDAGVRLALGSDSPVTSMDPWQAVMYAVWHHNADQRLTVAEAFAAHTRGGYELAGRDGGTLTPGRAASYVVWDQDDDLPRTGDGLPDLAADPQSPLPTARLTVVDGHVTFDRQGELT
ncbi:amidohydrolase [Ornithinimicrobium cryptoxanthini]|uniref:Amidohydrolase family protein n=1 Tax=Ornithinimicrobium cryptoxanthini TaxID=2934161 RepID=A0ABY4YE60_9MICO|nr:amidohydrolase family protein [Ornithinimicrobium cryptoxanthini]USQ74796.1 amidohydrolase family protein [Ornithinimicrobium cryptoxanthini]